MAANKTKPTAASVTAFVKALAEPTKRSDAKVLIGLMKSATGEDPRMWGPSIIGFGTYHYKYESGREGDTVLVGFSPRKPATVLYGVLGCKDAESLLAQLGKHTTGKGCLYIKRLSDVDHKILEQLIVGSILAKKAEKAPA
jgi:hypothetical protein